MLKSCLNFEQNLINHKVESDLPKNLLNYILASFCDNWQGIAISSNLNFKIATII
jgi:hypothetical protein